MLQMRPYQEEAHTAVFDALMDDHTSLIMTAATGTGKTVFAASVIKTLLREYGYKVLFLAPLRELIGQAYVKIRDMCELEEDWCEIEKEMGDLHFDPRALVVVGSIQTCSKPNRLMGWTPDVIFCDESHYALSPSFKALFDRFPNAIRIGLTATAMRGDKQPVFHENIDGSIVEVEDRETKKVRPAKLEECGFQKHVFDYTLTDAVLDGWLVGPRQYVVKSGVDISKVKQTMNANGDKDLSQGELNKALAANDMVVKKRINLCINKWKEVASDRPTVVFAPSVEYAHWAAQLWRDAGYTAAAIDAKTEKGIRDRHLEEVRMENVQVTCNYGIYGHGVDVDIWSCVVILRPTVNKGLAAQWVGRGTRTLKAVADQLGSCADAAERLALIEASGKRDVIVIDVVDVCGKHEIATLSATLGLPAKLDQQGHKYTEVAELVRKFRAERNSVTFDCPATYDELEKALWDVRILTRSGAASKDVWAMRADGSYSFGKAAPGYSATLTKAGDDWRLTVKKGAAVVMDRKGKSGHDVKAYFDRAAEKASKVISEHMAANKPSKAGGTWAQLSNKQTYCLTQNGFTREQIDKMEMKQARALCGKFAAAYHARRMEMARR